MKILLTGMSGTGKSSALAELERRGLEVVRLNGGDGVRSVREWLRSWQQ
jgi:dephospho-CoA kinase